MSKLTPEQKEKIEMEFSAVDQRLAESAFMFPLVIFLNISKNVLGKSLAETIEILLEEYSAQIQERFHTELRAIGLQKEEREETVKVIMRMINPWFHKDNPLTKFLKMLFPEKKESEGGSDVEKS